MYDTGEGVTLEACSMACESDAGPDSDEILMGQTPA
jgi:hypothetical protein